MIIARTRKGHGVEFMEKQPQAWHLGLLNAEQYADVVAEISARMQLSPGGRPRTPARWPMAEKKMVDVFSDVERETAMTANPAGYAVTELGAEDERIVTMAADMSNTVAEFIAKFPERYIEVGIAETNSVSLAAGLASAGLIPYIYSMSPFGMLKTCRAVAHRRGLQPPAGPARRAAVRARDGLLRHLALRGRGHRDRAHDEQHGRALPRRRRLLASA